MSIVLWHTDIMKWFYLKLKLKFFPSQLRYSIVLEQAPYICFLLFFVRLFFSLIFPLISPPETLEHAWWLHGSVLFLLQKCSRRNQYFVILLPAICCVSKDKRQDSFSWNFIRRDRLTDGSIFNFKVLLWLTTICIFRPDSKHPKIYDKWDLLVCKGKRYTKP